MGPSPVFVLVVDDHPAHRMVARCIFEAFGCEVTEASDGLEALGMASARRFDLILLDRHMPVCDGDEAARRMRAAGEAGMIVCHSSDKPAGAIKALYDRIVTKPATAYDFLDLFPSRTERYVPSIDRGAVRAACRPIRTA